jgi:type IV secretion system protein VirB9
MKPLHLIAASAALLVSTGAAHADNRIQQLHYDANAVTRLDACLGFQTMIEFGPGERIENVGVGDATQWLVVPNARADLLFVRPALATTHSNMTVATDRRRYVFELSAAQTQACARGEVVYYLRFQYDDAPAAEASQTAVPAQATPAGPQQRNSAYTFTGSQQNVPFRVFDDGHSTYFRWSEGAATPAVYVKTADGAETPASFTSRGDYLVTDQVAPRFVLRNGDAETVLFNEAYSAPRLDAGSPRPRPRERSGFWLFGRREANRADHQ